MELSKDIIQMAKSLKRNIVEITPHYICGSDTLLSSFSIVYLNGNIEVTDDLYYLGSTNLLTKPEIYGECKHTFESFRSRIEYLRSTCQFIENNNILYQANAVNTDQTHNISGLNDALAMKSKDGSTMINVDYTNLFLSTCGTMHPVNKSDVMDITIYENDDVSFIAKFSINKKKYTIYEYARFLYIQ